MYIYIYIYSGDQIRQSFARYEVLVSRMVVACSPPATAQSRAADAFICYAGHDMAVRTRSYASLATSNSPPRGAAGRGPACEQFRRRPPNSMRSFPPPRGGGKWPRMRRFPLQAAERYAELPAAQRSGGKGPRIRRIPLQVAERYAEFSAAHRGGGNRVRRILLQAAEWYADLSAAQIGGGKGPLHAKNYQLLIHTRAFHTHKQFPCIKPPMHPELLIHATCLMHTRPPNTHQ